MRLRRRRASPPTRRDLTSFLADRKKNFLSPPRDDRAVGLFSE
jgi:hypothetical protein